MLRAIPVLLLVLLWGLVLWIFAIPEPPHGHGVPHAEIPAMDQGGVGWERHGSLLILGWLFGSCLIASFVALLAFGTVNSTSPRLPRRCEPGDHRQPDEGSIQSTVHDGARRDMRVWVFLLGGLVYECVFAIMCWAYYDSLRNPFSTDFWGPFPRGTSWLLFGMWPVPAIFILVYVVNFERWVMPPSHSERFERLVEAARAREPGDSGRRRT